MRTEDFIQELARGSGRVTPLRPPFVRTLLWFGGSLLYLLPMMVAVLAVKDSAVAGLSPLSILQQLAALATGLAAAYAALSSVVPGARPAWRPLLIAAASAWTLLLAAGVAGDVDAFGTAGLGAETDWPCVAVMGIGGGGLLLGLVPMLRRGAPLSPRRTMLLGACGALSLASIQACLAAPHAFTLTIVVWHGATFAMLAAATGWLGRDLLRWPRLASGRAR
jgi:hypothetical protein